MAEQNTALFDYEELPYESYPFAETHPCHLASIALMYGLTPTPVDHCRVLELGCASGGNLLPIALRFPESTFVGIDLADSQVRQGNELIEQLNLNNIELISGDFAATQLPTGNFDYIIVHGLFSWIDDSAREQLLDLCREHLSPNGIAYISYNAFPGWHSRAIVRDLLRYHLKDCSNAEEAISKGRQLIDTFRTNVPNPETPESVLLASLLNELAEMPDWYVFHEFLEEHNKPMYFDEFIQLAESHQLKYLADSDLSTQIDSPTSAGLRQAIGSISSKAEQQTQYADFLNQRLLRRALLIPQETQPLEQPDPCKLTKLFIASPAVAKSATPVIRGDSPESFLVEKRGSMAFNSPIAKAGFVHLSSIWPEAVSFEELHQAAIALLPGDSMGDLALRTELSQAITDAFHCGAVSLDPIKPPCLKDPGETPLVWQLAQTEAKHGMRVTGLRHQYLVLDGFAKILIQLLDGTHSEDDCYRKLRDAKVEIYDEERRRTRIMSLSQLEHDQFHEWYTLVMEEFSRRALFVRPD